MRTIEELIALLRRVLALRAGAPVEFGIFVSQAGFRVQASGGEPTDTFPGPKAALRQLIAREIAGLTQKKTKHDEEGSRLAVMAAELETIAKEARDE